MFATIGLHAGRCITHTIAAPEGIRGQAADNLPKGESVTQFTQQDYDKFMQGYRSQYEEISMWVGSDDIEGDIHCLARHICAHMCICSPHEFVEMTNQ